ncbi:MAG: class F sortase [Chloroflexota bacterium]|nr:class F sortase [Chloroflexota bacterium]
MLKRKKLLVGGGGAAFVIGIGLLAFAAFSAFGGGDSPKPEVLVHLSASPSPTPVVTTAPATPTPVPTPPLGDEAYTMVIDKIGVDAPVEAFGLDSQQVPEVPTGPDAAHVVAWYNFSAKPGTGSNAVFAGHVTWFGAAVFYSLTDLTAGDQIKLRGQDGTLLTYKISDVYDVDPNDPNSIQVMAGTSSDTLTIITCDGSFTHTGDPVFGGEYNKRLVIRAGLQQVTPGAAVAAAASNSGG